MKRIGRTQIIRCKCGSIVAGCVLPYCYSDAGLQKDMCKYVQKGYEVDIINSSDPLPLNLVYAENCNRKTEEKWNLSYSN